MSNLSEFERLLIVGLPRCGTTLVATLLGAQPGIHFLTDYFPAFSEAVQRLGRSWSNTLSPSERRIALALVRDQFLRVRHPVLVKPESFSNLDELHRLVLAELTSHAERWVGHKLLLAPEQLRAVLDQTSIHCLLLLRDCRDAALSFFHRTGGGVERYVRNYCEMVRVARSLEPHPRLFTLRYEDLIVAPEPTLARLGQWLGVGIDPNVTQLRFQRSRAHGALGWSENSVFGDVTERFDSRPVGRWHEASASSIVRFAGWAARRELRELGYGDSALRLSPSERSSFYCLRALERTEHRAHDSLSSMGQWLRRRMVRLGP